MRQTIILNVDDHEPNRYARSRLLIEAGYFVEEAGTGHDALKSVDACRPSLIMLDVNLPDINGFEVCRRIRENPHSAHTAVLQISASATSDFQRVTALDSGADAYLIEPVDAEVLLATVRALLRMRRAEEALQKSNAALQAANEALRLSNEDLQRFSYAASHDLQEPLRTISSFATLLHRGYRDKLDPEGGEFLTYIEKAASRMSLLVKDLLIYAQVGDQNAYAAKPVAIASVLLQAETNLEQSLAQAEAEVAHGELPTVLGNEGQLVQLFQNLIGNAVKYCALDHKPRVHIKAENHSGNEWLFAISDNGIGIAPDYQEVIFGAFKRLHGQDVPGTGIGLAICRRIVERHGGRIWVESSGVGHGATFFFTLQSCEN